MGSSRAAAFGLRPARVSNTILRGGFLDRATTPNSFNPFSRGFHRNDSLRRFRGMTLTGMDEASMTGGRFQKGTFTGSLYRRRRMAQLSGGDNAFDLARGFGDASGVKKPVIRPTIQSVFNPRGFSRHHSVSSVTGAPGMAGPNYVLSGLANTFFGNTKMAQGALAAENADRLGRVGAVRRMLAAEGKNADDISRAVSHYASGNEKGAFSGGLLGYMRAGDKATALERKRLRRIDQRKINYKN